MITIIVPIHNTIKYLSKCLDSIKNQNFKDIEVLCIDSSNDGTTSLIEKYTIIDNRFKLIVDQNNSYGYKINLGIKKAKGNYIGIVDSDDYVDPMMYEKAYEAIKKYRLDFVKFDYYSIYPNGHRKYTNNSVDNYFYRNNFNSRKKTNIFFDSNIAIWSGLYRKKFLLDNKIKLNESPGAAFQDTSFFILTMIYANRVRYIKEAHYFYRRNSINSSSSSNKNVYCVIDEFDYILNRIKNIVSLSTEQYQAIICRKIFTYSWNYIRLQDNLAKQFEKKIRNELKEIYNNEFYSSIPTHIKKYINDSGILLNVKRK